MLKGLKKIAVLYGGPSSENAVSKASAKNAIFALKEKGYAVVPVELTKNNESNVKKILARCDLVFNALHGTFGEDGGIQALLDAAGIAYTGSGAAASAIGMHKATANRIAALSGIPVPGFIEISKKQKKTDAMANIKSVIGLPCVIKPESSGSSVGVSIVRNEKELSAALFSAFKESGFVMAQRYVTGREFTCAVLGAYGEEPEALPVIEIIPDGTFFDYRAKYSSKKTRELCPAEISPALDKKIRRMATAVHGLFGCRGLTRSDFIVDKSGMPYFLEINTLPGLTKMSLCPKAAAAAGMSFADLVEAVIKKSR